MKAGLRAIAMVLLGSCVSFGVAAQSLQKSAVQVDPGNTKQVGATFGYRLTYNCSSTSGPCLNAQVVDLLPAEVTFVSTVPASPTGDVAAINVTPNFGGSGRTRVQFVMITPLPAGNSGDLLVNVRFPLGSTPNGTVATNTADGINLGNSPGTFTTPPVNVTAVASVQVNLQKTLQTAPANLDLPETYRLRITVPNNGGALRLDAIGPVVDTLPPGTVFNGATPAADCQPGCVGTTPATVTWTSPCTVPLNPGNNCDIAVNVTFPSGTFPSGTNVTNSFTATATPLGQPPQSFGPNGVTHPVTNFVPAPAMGFNKNMAGGTPNPPTLNQTFSYDLNPSNNGNVPLDNLMIIDTLPVQMQVMSVTTGAYNNLGDFGAGEGVRVSYEKNTALGVFTLWGSSPNTSTSTTLTSPPPGLGAGEYVTRVRWQYGQASVGMGPSTRPLITGRIVNPANNGSPVAIGNSIQNCADLTAVYTAGPTNVTRNDCENFTLSGPFVQLNPAKDNLSGGGPFNPGQTVSWRLRVRSDARSSDPVPLADLVATDLLPVNLIFSSWTFDDQGTGLPAPQVFDQIPNFAGTGRTLLRWRWNAGSGNLGVNQEVRINISTTIRNGAVSGPLSNTFTLEHDNPGLGQRCSGSSQADPLDLDGDANTAETLCSATTSVTVAPIAQLVSSKRVNATCDADFTATSAGLLSGSSFDYELRVQNVGTVPMQDFVIVDILPVIGDTGVRDTNPRSSTWTPQLVSPVIPPPGTTLFYSTSGNPCRGEVGGPTTSCDPPNWTTVPPVPLSSTRSFKIEFGDRVVQPFDFLAFQFRMASPATLPPGGIAFNSFAYQTNRSDGLGSLAAEPQKVGVGAGSCTGAALGDFVWRDTNRNGQQDDGATGVNDVFVRLFKPGTDGIPGTIDDVLESSTLTQNGPGGAPGWYQFPGLVPGTYRVCFTPPPGLDLTNPNVGADGSDSDANTANGCAPPVTLAPNESNQTIDAGLVTPLNADAALGNYTFIDADNDGIQDGPLDLGLNGVSVRLYADDGDGIAQPGAADGAPVAQQVTQNDVHGIPGYYLFEQLIPGVPYYVQFVLPSGATGFTTANAGGNDSVDSDAVAGTGLTPVVTLGPGEVNLTIDAGIVFPVSTLALGDQVWRDTNNNGIFEPQSGEPGIDGVRVDLYRDVNGDGLPSLDEYRATTQTETRSGFAGIYRFDELAPGTYIVVIPTANFAGGEPLVGLASSTGNDPAPDPDDDVNGDDNGRTDDALVQSLPVTLTDNGEPTSEDGNNDTNLTVDFGFIAAVTPPQYDYGDAPDAAIGASPGNYQTVTLDGGAYHAVGVSGAPHLGACVDADDGANQGIAADTDDATSFGQIVGTCAIAGDDEDGVTFTNPATPGSPFAISVSANGAACTLNAWIDWNADGVFGNSAGEQIATNLAVPTGPATALSPVVPAGAVPGVTFARFRCASTGGLTPTGPAPDGEVEDYRVSVAGHDLGDDPASYGTSGAGAAAHRVDPLDPLMLGACVDLEADGVPGTLSNGDDGAQGRQGGGLCFDDEDGVTLPATLHACATENYTVVASAAGRLDAFVDFNRDGDFGDAGEAIATNVALTAGSNPLSFAVPCAAAAGTTYTRFRISSTGNVGPTGNANDGEVEDHVAGIVGVDFGDAPDPTYPTLLASNGARHSVDPSQPLFLGTCVDTEGDGAPNAGATGDDLADSNGDVGTCLGNDDEDGIVFPQPLVACLAGTATVTANANGLLDAWIDFNRDGDWNDAGEQIADDSALNGGANAVNFVVPCTASAGIAHVRLRFSTAGVAGVTGLALDGEVEDHQVTLRAADFGDAPASYGTSGIAAAANGILADGSLRLGVCVDSEVDGAPGVTADGDDLAASAHTVGTCASANDDEDGATATGSLLAPLTAGGANTITLTVTNTVAATSANLCGYVDLDGNGDFNGAGEAASTTVATGTSNGNADLVFNVPLLAAQATYARFRLQTAACAPTGAVADGEVEDYRVSILRYDLGDLPDSGAGTGAGNYETLRAGGGARHLIVPGLRIGAVVDNEFDGAPSANADGDDSTGQPDDEDGVTFPTFELGSPGRATVNVTNTSGTSATLCGFIDWNADGDFGDTSESTSQPVPDGTNAANIVLNFGLVPEIAVLTPYSRFRLTTSAAACVPNGDAPDGEVEDYLAATTGDGALSLGNLVFEDLDNDGLFDVGTETGIDGVAVTLYLDDDANGVPDGAPLATTTTDANGGYLFTNLLPSIYLVEIVRPADYVGSTGTGRWNPTGPFEPAPDPDNDVDNDDNGDGTLSVTIRSKPVELLAKTEPSNDGDADFNTNLTVDFGLVYNFDLALTKRLADGQPIAASLGSPATFTITVYNQGTVDAQNIVITDYIPAGMELRDTDWTQVGNTATYTIAALAAGASIDVDITLGLVSPVNNPMVNRAEITAAEDSTGNTPPDRDSTPDPTPDNDGEEVDDDTSNTNGDEDDADPAELGVLLDVPVPTLGVWGLLLLIVVMGWLGRRGLRRVALNR